jgi:hypothetical protein
MKTMTERKIKRFAAHEFWFTMGRKDKNFDATQMLFQAEDTRTTENLQH